jgi:hypothetical protein
MMPPEPSWTMERLMFLNTQMLELLAKPRFLITLSLLPKILPVISPSSQLAQISMKE